MQGPDLSLKGLKLNRALYGGGIAALIIAVGTYFTGNVGEYEALSIIDEMRSSLRFACAAMLTATSTILALILTLLSFSSNYDQKMRAEHYARIQWIALFAIGTFIGALILLMLLAVPLKNASDELSGHYDLLYYFFLIYGAFLAGFMVAIILMLYSAATEIILLVHPDKEADFLIMKDEEDVQEGEEERSEKPSEEKED